MADFDPVFPGDEWGPIDPIQADTRIVPNLPAGSVGNRQLADGIDPRKLQGYGIKVALSAGQTVSTASTETIEYATEVFNQGFPPLAAFTITVPYDGIYTIVMGQDWGGAAQVDDETGSVLVNGTTAQSFRSPNLVANRQRWTLTTVEALTAGDDITATVRHASGADRTLGSSNPENVNLTVIYNFTI